MELETVFSIANSTAMVGWLLLVLAPRWRLSTRLITPVVLPFLLAVVYGAFLFPHFFESEGGYSSLGSVRELLATPELLLAGWVHYLAFDLFVGSWEVRDAQRVGLPHVLVVPCLALTFLFGPVGLGAYFLLRASKGRIVIPHGTE